MSDIIIKGDDDIQVTITGGDTPTTFASLTDTPSSYSGEGLNFLRVNAGETAIEFTSGSSTDPDAIHDNVSGEISAITEKATPVDADLLVIEDSADSNNKKKIQIGNLPSSGSGDVVGPASAVDDNIVTFDLTTGKLIQDSGVNISAVTANSAKVTNATHSGEVTGDTALTIADNVVDEANLKLDEVPTNDYVLTADSTKSGGMKWAANVSGFADPMTTRGDIIIRDATNTTTRLGVGTNGQVLKSDGTDISWGTPDGGNVSTSGTPVDDDFAKFVNGTDIEGRSYSEVKTDLSLNNVENTALSTWSGSTSLITLGIVTTGEWRATTPINTIYLADGSVSNTEFQYINSLTSNAQTQLDAKTNKLITLNDQTGTTYTLVLTDADKLVTLSNASAITMTVPPNSSVAFPTGTQILLYNKGAGQVTVAQGSGVTIRTSSTLLMRAQYSQASLVKIGTDEWIIAGDMEAA